MTAIIQGSQLRTIVLGNRVAKSQALSAATLPVFNVTGGEVLITSLYLRVTTTIAAAGGTLALQVDPTAGDTVTLVTATDLGTADATAGTLLGVYYDQDGTSNVPVFAESAPVLSGVPVSTGEIELVGASGIDGAVEVVLTYVPLTDGAAVAAA